ncbi:MAG TPA: glycogen-binding domain-containing protein, partial [Longimicrobiaceae bacterium]|nr:glycogen-binding domain-containing protein [Longimicrobiaceae bacterium]
RRRPAGDRGVDFGANVYGYTASPYEVDVNGVPVTVDEESDWGGTAEVIPSLEFRRGPVGVELRSGVVTTFGPVVGEWLAVTAFDGGATVSATPAEGVQVGAVGRYMRFPEGGYPYLGGSVQLSRGPGVLWAFAGRWMSDSLDSPREGFGVGASVTPLPGLQVMGGWQQEPSDPLYLNAPRRTWSLRVSRTLGRTRPAIPALAPPTPADGNTVIRLPAAAVAEAPSVLGDFTDWKPVPMVRNGPFWELRLPLAPGIHHYAFRTAAGEVFVPDHLPATDDGMGGKSAVLVVQ